MDLLVQDDINNDVFNNETKNIERRVNSFLSTEKLIAQVLLNSKTLTI